jgi:hypothetical protein
MCGHCRPPPEGSSRSGSVCPARSPLLSSRVPPGLGFRHQNRTWPDSLVLAAIRVGLISGTFINDRRDDLERHPRHLLLARSLAGQSRVCIEPRFPLPGRNSSYHRVSRDYVLSRNTTFGWIANYGKSIFLCRNVSLGGAVTADSRRTSRPRDLSTGFPFGRALLFNRPN